MHLHWRTISVPTILFEVLTSSPTWNDYDAGISFWTFSSGFPSALLVTFLSLEQFQFPYDSASSMWIDTVFFPLLVLDWPFIFLFTFFSKTNLKVFPSKGKTFKILHCIFSPTILDWWVTLRRITLDNSCVFALYPSTSEQKWWTLLTREHRHVAWWLSNRFSRGFTTHSSDDYKYEGLPIVFANQIGHKLLQV